MEQVTDHTRVDVYIVCQAEYDDNGPVAVFTNRAAAMQHADDSRTVHGCEFEVIPLPLLGTVPQRVQLHLHAGRVCEPRGVVEDEQAWTVDHWDFQIPREPVVTIDARRPEMPRVHVAAATAEAAKAAFWETAAGAWQESGSDKDNDDADR